MSNVSFTYHDENPISPPSTATSSTDSQHAAAHSLPNLACWGAVCAGAGWSLSSLSSAPAATSQEKKTSKLRTALECISSRAVSFFSRSGTLVVSGTYPEKASVCLSDEGHSVVTYGHFLSGTATPMPHASGRSSRGGDRHGPNNTSSGTLCAELSELTASIPIGVTGLELARGQRKNCLLTSRFSSLGEGIFRDVFYSKDV